MTRFKLASTTRKPHALLANCLVVLALLAGSFISIAMPVAAQEDEDCLPEGFAEGSNPSGFTCEPGPEGHPVIAWKAEDIDNYSTYQDSQLIILVSNSGMEIRDLLTGTSLWTAQGFDDYWTNSENELAFLESNGSVEVRELRSGNTLVTFEGHSDYTTYTGPKVLLIRYAANFEVRDIATGDLLWSEEADDTTNVWAFGEDDAQLVIERTDSIELRDIRTGKALWAQETPSTADVQEWGLALYLTEPLESDAASENPPHREIARLDAGTGEELWRQTVPDIRFLRTSDRQVVVFSLQSDNTATPEAISTWKLTTLDASTGAMQWETSVDLVGWLDTYFTDSGSHILIQSWDAIPHYQVLEAATGETVFSLDIDGRHSWTSMDIDDDTSVLITSRRDRAGTPASELPGAKTILTAVNMTTWETEWEVEITGDASNFLVDDDVLYATIEQRGSVDVRAYDTATGQERWRSPLPQMAIPQWIYDGRLFLHDQLEDDAYESWSSVDARIGQNPQLESGGCTGGNLYPVDPGAFCVSPEEVGIAGLTPHALWTVDAIGTGCAVYRAESPGNSHAWFYQAYDRPDPAGCGLSIINSLLFLRVHYEDDSYDIIAIGGDDGPNAATPGMLEPGIGLEIGMNAAIVGGEIPLRGAPAPSSVEILMLTEGATVELVSGPIEENGETWWQVRDPTTGSTGYVPAEHLSAMLN